MFIDPGKAGDTGEVSPKILVSSQYFADAGVIHMRNEHLMLNIQQMRCDNDF